MRVMENKLLFGNAILWVAIWLGFMLVYTFLDVVIWRKLFPAYEKYLNIASIILCITLFLHILIGKTGYRIGLLENISLVNIILAVGCAILFYLLLDKCLDPVFERLFPASEQSYQKTITGLSKAPVISLLQICILAPIIEEILMRGFILNGLSLSYGKVIGLLVSALLFALLHFNMVQTLSAFICGIVLGLLYMNTNSILCCILAHCGYNLISYVTLIYPNVKKG